MAEPWDNGFDPVIHQPTRLRMMASLMALGGDEWIDFVSLKDELRLTDGNLGAQILKLEEAGYVRVNKLFVRRRPKTLVQLTSRGRAVFEAHREALQRILDGG